MNTIAPTYINDPIANHNNTFDPRAAFSYTASSQNYTDQSFPRSCNTIIMNAEKPSADVDGGEPNIGGGSKGNMVPLPLDFIPGDFDVLCGRGKKNYNSLGNQRLRRIVDSYVEQYSAATSRQDKSDILSAIVDEVRSASPNGGFIKQDPVTERWFEVGDFLAREKVSQAFRDALSFQYRSSKKFKHEKRRQRDKAAKLAKKKGQQQQQQQAKAGGEKKSDSKSKSLPPLEGKPLLKKKESLTTLREEPSMIEATSFMTPPGLAAGNVHPTATGGRPHRTMSTGHAPPGANTTFLQGMQARQGFGFQQQQELQQQQAGAQFFPFNNNPGMPSHSDQVTRHSSWPGPQLFSNPLFNPLHAAGLPMGPDMAQNMAAMAPRRFSTADAMMADSEMNQQAAFQHQLERFHNSDPHPMSWSQQMQMEQQNSTMLQHTTNNPQAALHAFQSGMSAAHPGVAALSAAGGAGMPHAAGMMPTGGMPPHLGNLPTNPTAGSSISPLARFPPQQQQRQAGGGGGGGGRRKGPLERSGSNVSTTSATAIVAHLESSFSELDQQDENPFEPVPLPGAQPDQSDQPEERVVEEKDDESMTLPGW